jgi:hypothetical protein
VDTAADTVLVQGDPGENARPWAGRLSAFARGERVAA